MELDAGEADVVTSNLPGDIAHITSNVVLWPKVFVTTLNTEFFESLSDEQQDWVQEAADLARDASVAAPYRRLRGPALLLRERHRRTRSFGAAAGRAPREGRADAEHSARGPGSAELMAGIESLAEQYPGTDVPTPQGGCAGAQSPAEALPTGTPPIPEGTYRAEIPVEATSEVGNGPGWSGTWTLEIEDGTYAITCRPLDLPGNDCGNSLEEGVLDAGYLRGDNEDAWFVPDGDVMAQLTDCTWPEEPAPDICLVLEPYGAKWRADGQDAGVLGAVHAAPRYTLSLVPWVSVR